MINQLIPIAVENIDAGIVVSGELFYVELLFYKYGGSYQTHIVGRVLDDIIYQLLFELLIFVNLKGIVIEAAEKFFKLIKIHHIAV